MTVFQQTIKVRRRKKLEEERSLEDHMRGPNRKIKDLKNINTKRKKYQRRRYSGH